MPRRRTHAERYSDNAALAIPKPGMRIRDEAVLNWARRLGVCEWCGRPGPTDASHTRSVGAGGPDSYANVTALCRLCHTSHHAGHEPTADQLLATAARRDPSNAWAMAMRFPAGIDPQVRRAGRSSPNLATSPSSSDPNRSTAARPSTGSDAR